MVGKIMILDNYDSFTYNLVHAVEKLTGQKIDVYRNDKVSLKEIGLYNKIILSPGPGIPDEAGILKEVIKRYSSEKSILGVCLGHQAIGEVFGGKLLNMKKVYHGVATPVTITSSNDKLFDGIPKVIQGGRYHSWLVDSNGLPSCFDVTAVDNDQQIMAMKHKEHNLRGLQFHPESVLTEYGDKIIQNWLFNC